MAKGCATAGGPVGAGTASGRDAGGILNIHAAGLVMRTLGALVVNISPARIWFLLRLKSFEFAIDASFLRRVGFYTSRSLLDIWTREQTESHLIMMQQSIRRRGLEKPSFQAPKFVDTSSAVQVRSHWKQHVGRHREIQASAIFTPLGYRIITLYLKMLTGTPSLVGNKYSS